MSYVVVVETKRGTEYVGPFQTFDTAARFWEYADERYQRPFIADLVGERHWKPPDGSSPEEQGRGEGS